MGRARLALISDIHGNEVALRAVLQDIQARGVDEIACLGDVATLGPKPREALALVVEHCDHLILGNHDEYMFAPESIRAHTSAPPVLSAVDECRCLLTAEEIETLRTFAQRVELTDIGTGSLLFHGSPASNNCDLLAETPEEELDQQLQHHAQGILAGGHTHVQLLRRYRGRWLINPGSVGMPFERFVAGAPPTVLPHAEYAIVESNGHGVSVTFRQVELSRAALLRDIRAWSSALSGYLEQQYLR
jgi:putative phosphoesterase